MGRTSTRAKAMYKLCLSICLLLTACIPGFRSTRYVPPEEAAWFKFPSELPLDGRKELPGAMATAIQLALDDFLPRGAGYPWGATPQQICLRQRQSYDVEVARGSEGVIWVTVGLSPGACTLGPGPLLDVGTTYAVDTTGWRIRARSGDGTQTEFPRTDVPESGRRQVPANMAAAIQLSLDDFLPRGAKPSSEPGREACLERRDSYDVTAAPAPDGVVLVQFVVNPAVCATHESIVDVTNYAVDVRTMRILSIQRRTRPRDQT